ncbi:unnamed protein product [Phytophthora lilii]|uniref:Unnamed protein product n=1 Tax=Phytophthora lilii TaxID=2077276 RepID=A0A9W7CL92_9STRA|nr:unnamed protein product [Phytophthora lilii]
MSKPKGGAYSAAEIDIKILARIDELAAKNQKLNTALKTLPKEGASVLKALRTKDTELVKAMRAIPTEQKGFDLFCLGLTHSIEKLGLYMVILVISGGTGAATGLGLSAHIDAQVK